MPAWLNSLKVYRDRRMLTLLLLGFSSGLPLLLVYSTLSFWLLDEGFSLAAVGAFSAAFFPYSLKFLWAPFIDRVPIPWLSRRMGQRRSWLLITQLSLVSTIAGVALSTPKESPLFTFVMVVAIALASASQDIVVDAYRVELLEDDEQGAGAAVAVFGYRIGMLVAGAGALYLAAFIEGIQGAAAPSIFTGLVDAFGSWRLVYFSMAGLMSVGLLTTLASREPLRPPSDEERSLQSFRAQIKDAVWGPLRDLMSRRGWLLFLLFIMLFKLGDALAGKMLNPLLVELDFSKTEIANVAKTYGIIASIVGVILGGWLVRSLGIVRALWVAGILQLLSNFAFVWQAQVGHDLLALVVTISVENLTGGLGTAAFVAYLSSLCNRAYTATQYALLTALSGLIRTTIGGSTGLLAQSLGWTYYFIMTAGAAVPGLFLLYILMRRGWTGLDSTPTSASTT